MHAILSQFRRSMPHFHRVMFPVLISFAFAGAVFAATGGAVSAASDVDAVVTVDAAEKFQTMQGFGASARLFEDPHVIGGRADDPNPANGLKMSIAEQNAIFQKLYGDLGLTRLRLGMYPVRNEPVNDNGDPDITDVSKFSFLFKQGDGFLDYVTRARQYGLEVWWHSPGNLESWMTEKNPEEYAEWAMVFLRRWRAQGLELPYWSIMNEPGYQRGGYWSGEYIRTVVKLLGRKLEAEGFKTKIVVPDDLNPTQAKNRLQVILADQEARKYIGALAYHLYGDNASDKKSIMQMSAQYRIPVWMSEYSKDDAFEWALLVHDLIANYGVSAVDYMNTYMGQDAGNLITLDRNGTDYTGYRLRKHYYTFGQFTRYVRPGSSRIRADSTLNHVKATAFSRGSDLVIVALNDSAAPKSIRVKVGGLQGISKFSAVRTSDSENWANVAQATLNTSGEFNYTLPSRSITTFISSGASGGSTTGGSTTGSSGTGGTTGGSMTGGTTGGTTGGVAGACNLYASGSSVPAGFGVPWNPLTSARELLLSSYCNSNGSVAYTVGVNNKSHYVYKQGYFYTSQWHSFTMTGPFVQGSTDWLDGQGKYTHADPPASDYFWVGYLCQWTGSEWKCGCRDSACTASYWQLQGVKR